MKLEPTLTHIITADLNDQQRDAIIQLCLDAHQDEEFRKLFSHYLPDNGRHSLAYLGSELVGHAVATTRWLQPEGQPLLKTAYIDAVSSAPAHQGQGIGSAVMRHLATRLTDYQLACLETERISFYARIGWELWQGALAVQKENELIFTPEQQGIMILRLPQTPKIDITSRLTAQFDGRFW